MNATAAIGALAALFLVPVVASGQPGFQPPPPAFQTPSGNVHCLFRQGTLRCDVLEHAYPTPAEAAGCSPAWEGRLALRAEGSVTLPCSGAPVRNDEAFVLGYGARWIGQGVECESLEAGLRCANRSGHGFQASRTKLDLF
jgi:hypothetical protein